MATSTLRFIILGDDRAGPAFGRFARQVGNANKAINRNILSLEKQRAALGGVAIAAVALGGGSGLLAMAGPIGAATAAMGAFAVVAIPTISRIQKSVTQLQAAELAYNSATTTAAKKAAKQKLDVVKASLSKQDLALAGTLEKAKSMFRALGETFVPLINQVLKLGLTLLTSLKPALDQLVPAGAKVITNFIEPLIEFTKSPTFKSFITNMVTFGNAAAMIVGPALVSLFKVFMRLFIETMPAGLKLLGQLLPAITQMVRDLTPVIVVAAKITANVLGWLSANKLLVPVLWAIVAALIAMKLALLTNPIVLIGAAIVALVFIIIKYHKQIWDFIKRIWNDIWGFIKGLWNTVLDFAKQWWPLLLGPAGLIVKYHNQIFGFIKGIWNNILSFFKNLWNSVWDTAKNIWGNILSWFKSIPDRLINGVRLLWDKVTGFFANLWHDIVNGVKRILGLHSPSSVFRNVGVNIMQGLWNGLKAEAPKVLSWMEGMAGSLVTSGHFPGIAGGAPGGTAAQNEVIMQGIANKRGWGGGAEWQALYNVEMAEAGFSLTATNKNSGAYGMAQFINGPSEYYAYGGNPNTAAGQSIAMLNYIAQRYGDPIHAWAFHLSHGWYDHGGWLMPGQIGINTTRHPEMIRSKQQEDELAGLLRQNNALLGELIGAVDDNARTTAAGVSRAFGGASRSAMYGALHSAR